MVAADQQVSHTQCLPGSGREHKYTNGARLQGNTDLGSTHSIWRDLKPHLKNNPSPAKIKCHQRLCWPNKTSVVLTSLGIHIRIYKESIKFREKRNPVSNRTQNWTPAPFIREVHKLCICHVMDSRRAQKLVRKLVRRRKKKSLWPCRWLCRYAHYRYNR